MKNSLKITINVILFVVWLVIGILVVTNKKGIDKTQYALCWLCLMIQLIKEITRSWT